MGEHNLRESLTYLDDIVIFLETFDRHLDRLDAVFVRLHRHNLKLKASKPGLFFKGESNLPWSRGIKTDA